MPETSAQTPPPLTQDPEEPTIKPLLLSKKADPTSFDGTKVLAAIGFILTVTILIIGLMWITIQNLENRVNELETDIKTTDTKKNSASEAAEKLGSKKTTKSATKSSR